MFQREREYLVRVSPGVPQAVASAAATAVDEFRTPKRDHSGEFATVNWYGETYRFSATQRAVVAVLWGAMDRGIYDVHQTTLLREADSNADDLRDLFRGHPAWKTMIQRSSLHGGQVGCFRLVAPVED